MTENISACSTLVALLRQRALHQGDQTAYTFLADGDLARGSLTYAELDRRARSIATMLQTLGLAGERAVLLYPTGLDYVAAFFGCLYAGVIAVPAYPPRRKRSWARLQAIIADSSAAAVLTSASVGSPELRAAAQAWSARELHWLLGEYVSDDAASGWKEPALGAASLALLQYTSGSTAAPRGVMITHGNLLHNCHWVQRRFEHDRSSRGVIWLPLYHDMGLVGGIIQPLYVGLHCYLLSPVSVFTSPYSWLQAISRFRATTSGGPNFAYDLCTRQVTAEQRATLDLSCWQVAFTGAEPVRAQTLERFARMFAPCGFRSDAFYPCYGLAEATVMATGGRKNAPLRVLSVCQTALESHRVVESPRGQTGSQTLVGCGCTLGDHRLIIVHPDNRTVCPPGQVGEVWLAGPSVAKGYWNNVEETWKTFRARLADSAYGPYLRTGDLGFLKDGELYLTGRLKDLIILRGRNLYPQDLELSTEQSHPALQPGCAVAFSIDLAGEERLVVACEAVPRQRPDIVQVAESVARTLAEEHEVELHAFVLLKPGGLPRTSSGKVKRRTCRAMYMAGTLEVLGQWREGDSDPTDEMSRTTLLAIPPHKRRGFLESYFQNQLARQLGLAPATVNVQQPVCTFGLDSLKTVELTNRLEQHLGVTLPASSLLQGGNIAELANQVLRALAAGTTRPSSNSMRKFLREIERLSDDQVKQLLDRESVSAGGALP